LEPRLRKLSRWIRLQPAGNLLDIGCGDGGFSFQFILKGWQVSGIDLTAEQVEQARAKKVQAVQGDASQKLPFPDQSFTAVVASEVIEHLVDTDRFLEDIWRVLKPQGSLYLTTLTWLRSTTEFAWPWAGIPP
jgi:ubiquinone/menaquinone biosynthesis C-methylase UbiE